MQPIIENCINHGYKKKETLHIDVTITIVKEELITVIKDNGDGMSNKTLLKIITSIEDQSSDSSHIGLNNVHRRIQLLYGPSFGIKIKSDLDKGTTVTINMPVVTNRTL